MSKKNFKDNNPALQFISPSKETIAPIEVKTNTDTTPNTDVKYYIDNTDNTGITDNTHNTNNTHKTNNTNTTYLKKTAQKEIKSKRLNLLIQPSLYQTFTKIAYMKQLSVNELILRTMKEYADQNTKTIQKYDDFMNNKE